MKYTLPKIFQNKYFLYTVTLFAIGNLMGYLANEKYNSLSFFLAVGLLSSYFSKNMSVVLLIAMATTSIFSNNNFIEGFKEGVGHEGQEAPKPQKEKKVVQSEKQVGTPEQEANKAVAPELKAANKANDGQAAAVQTLPSPAQGAEQATQDSTKEVKQKKGVKKQNFANREGLGVGPDRTEICYKRNKAVAGEWQVLNNGKLVGIDKCGGGKDKNLSWGGSCMVVDKVDGLTGKPTYQYMTNTEAQENPSKCSTANGKWCPLSGCTDGDNFSNMKKKSHTESREARVDGVDESVGDRIDYANTMKQSMNNLQDMLGADGMKGLAAETKRLVAQQKELVDSLGQMAPVLNSAKSTLDSLNLPDMKGITNILGVLKGGK